MKKFFDWLFGLFGYVSKDDTDTKYADLLELYGVVKVQVDEIMAARDSLQKLVDETSRLTMKELNDENIALKLENDRVQQLVQDGESYYRQVQEQLSDEMHKDPVFSFSRSPAIPGAATYSAEEDYNGDDTTVVISGRSVFIDEVTAKIHNAHDVREKYMIALNNLKVTGMLDRIAQDLINHGCLQIVLAYNKACTTNELYFNLKCEKPKATIYIEKEMEEGK